MHVFIPRSHHYSVRSQRRSGKKGITIFLVPVFPENLFLFQVDTQNHVVVMAEIGSASIDRNLLKAREKVTRTMRWSNPFSRQNASDWFRCPGRPSSTIRTVSPSFPNSTPLGMRRSRRRQPGPGHKDLPRARATTRRGRTRILHPVAVVRNKAQNRRPAQARHRHPKLKATRALRSG